MSEVRQVLGIPLDKAPGPNQPLPFDHARAHKLYSALFGEVQDLIKRQAPADRAVRSADAVALPGARDQAADIRAITVRSPGSPGSTPSPSCLPSPR